MAPRDDFNGLLETKPATNDAFVAGRCSRTEARLYPNWIPCASGRSVDQFTVFVWRRM